MRLRGLIASLVVAAFAACAAAAPAAAKTVWLCFPGHKPNPCTPGLSTTVYSLTLKKLGVEHPEADRHPGSYRAQCSSASNANVLQITALRGAQTPKPSPDPTWGLHLLDANIALGNLIAIVNSEARAFAKSGR